MKKVLLSCHQFFPRYYTGTETLVLTVADELKSRGYEVAIITTEPWIAGIPLYQTSTVVQEEWQGHSIWRVYVKTRHEALDHIAHESCDESLRSLYKDVLDAYKPDVVHSFHFLYLTTVLAEEVKRKGIPLFFTMTDYWLLCTSYTMLTWDDKICHQENTLGCMSCLMSQYLVGCADRKKRMQIRLSRKFPQIARFFSPGLKALSRILQSRRQRHKDLIDQGV